MATNCCEDKTVKSDQKYIADLFQSIEQLNTIYKSKIDKKKISNDQSLFDFQSKFWKSFQDQFTEASNEYEKNFNELCNKDFEQRKWLKQLIFSFNILKTLYTHNILHANWPISDLESRKLTIFIAIDELQKYQREILIKLKEMNKSNGKDCVAPVFHTISQSDISNFSETPTNHPSSTSTSITSSTSSDESGTSKRSTK